MTTFFSRFHGLYVAQYSAPDGTLYTGRGSTHAEAIFHCLNSIAKYA